MATQPTTNLAFFQTAATVIPVLFVSLVFQARTFQSKDAGWLITGILLLGGAIYGEVVALDVLAEGKAGVWERYAVAWGMAALAVDLIALTVGPVIGGLWHGAQSRGQKTLVIFVGLAFLSIVARSFWRVMS